MRILQWIPYKASRGFLYPFGGFFILAHTIRKGGYEEKTNCSSGDNLGHSVYCGALKGGGRGI